MINTLNTLGTITTSGSAALLYTGMESTMEGINNMQKKKGNQEPIKSPAVSGALGSSLASTVTCGTTTMVDNYNTEKYLADTQNYVESLSYDELTNMLEELENIKVPEETENKTKRL